MALGVVALLVAGLLPAPATAQSAREPVIFVHGWFFTDVWGAAVDDFQANGYQEDEIFLFTYDTFFTSNSTTAEDFGDYVDQVLQETGADKVDVVSHSMGSLSTRECIKSGDCGGKVDDWVSMGGANHGTNIAFLCLIFSPVTCNEMLPSSQYLQALNQPPEVTDGAESWSTLWTPNDGIILPAESTLLEGANNVQISSSLNHLSMLTDAGTLAQVRDLVAD